LVSIYSSGASDPGSLLESIEEAEKAGLIFSVTNSSNPGYEFSHELIRQAAIGTISPARRQRLHLEVADAIERIYAISPESPYAGTLDDYVADLAHHGQGGDRVKAVHYLRLAAQQAAQRSASSVAIDQLTNALRILKILPESPQRDRQELILQTRLGPLLIASKGNAADEVGMAYARAVELGRRGADITHLFPVLFGMRSFHFCAPICAMRANWRNSCSVWQRRSEMLAFR